MLFKRTFPHPNLSNDWTCPICSKAEDRPVVLLPILGTTAGGLYECKQVHADCLEFGVRELVQL